MNNLVWFASYPRSGNTWFRVFLSCLLSESPKKNNLNLDEISLIANSRVMFDELTGLNSSDLTISEINNLKPVVYRLLSDETDRHLYLKTHEQNFINASGNPVFPTENSFGCIYIVRNPLDVVVSNSLYFNRSTDEIIERFNNPSFAMHASTNNLYPVLEEKLGTWSDHVKSWINSGIKTSVIRYEDMVAKPLETFIRAIGFLDLGFPEDLIQEAISATSFENLKQSEALYGFKEKFQGTEAFFRNGKTDSWKTSLSPIQVNCIVDNHHEIMKRLGYLEKL